jgi:hypothetical protein
MALDATVGGAFSNAYISTAVADAILSDALGTEAWTGAALATKERALVSATARLDQETYKGLQSSTSQALAWPRVAVFRERVPIPFDQIPREIQRATAILAHRLLVDPALLEPTGLEGFQNVKVGPLDVTPREDVKAGGLPDDVRREIRSLIVGSGNTVRLRRG